MIAYPPKPTSILPDEESFDPTDWIVQPKYRGWRVVIHNNDVFTRHQNLLPISMNYKTNAFEDFQLDGEILNPKRHTEYGVAKAIKEGSWKIKIFDIYVPGKNYMLTERLQILREVFDIYPVGFNIIEYSSIFKHLVHFKHHGFEGIVIKRRSGIYKASKYTSIIDTDWVKLK